MATSADRLLLYARTISRLKAKQLVYLVLRRLLTLPMVLPTGDLSVKRRGHLAMQEPLRNRLPTGGEHQFQFLNVSRPLGNGDVDWISTAMPKLWRYNLHYFDYILDVGRPAENVCKLISDWIQGNPVGRGVGWEPYPLSLRIVNWIKLFVRAESSHVQSAWLKSLYQQALWLEKNIEHHILGNHLLKNGKALFFAGLFFSGADADRWLRKGTKIIVEQAREQILADGGHFERSPMYHAIVVEDYLDSLNLIMSCPGLVNNCCPCIQSSDVDVLMDKTRSALDFLYGVCKPDGSIPLFNDSAYGIAPPLCALTEYASRVIGYEPPWRGEGLRVSMYPTTGYFAIRDGGDMLIVDCGELGPSYQAGHAHCDTLSFELTQDGRALIVDSGVCDYENGEMRRYVRSTRAHNTVMIDGREQSELWDIFRVARRARPLEAKLERISASKARFSGSHDGFSRLPGRPRHARQIDYEGTGIWTVIDSFSGNGEHGVDAFIHLHPDLDATLQGRRILIADRDVLVAEIEMLCAAEIVLEQGWYCPEFGKRRKNVAIRLSDSGALPRFLAYRIAKAKPDSNA